MCRPNVRFEKCSCFYCFKHYHACKLLSSMILPTNYMRSTNTPQLTCIQCTQNCHECTKSRRNHDLRHFQVKCTIITGMLNPFNCYPQLWKRVGCQTYTRYTTLSRAFVQVISTFLKSVENNVNTESQIELLSHLVKKELELEKKINFNMWWNFNHLVRLLALNT